MAFQAFLTLSSLPLLTWETWGFVAAKTPRRSTRRLWPEEEAFSVWHIVVMPFC